ncbi:MAG TPA: hypothetical protein VM639_17970 [Dongiaceae bacterium]|nr:hypothetical protein [Dongiaceae bacterium]
MSQVNQPGKAAANGNQSNGKAKNAGSSGGKPADPLPKPKATTLPMKK